MLVLLVYFWLDIIYSIVSLVMDLFHYVPQRCRLSVVAGVLGMPTAARVYGSHEEQAIEAYER
eukprot:COSAG01_NODE_1027_length_12036_cov_4.718857_6_plen_63_part_00